MDDAGLLVFVAVVFVVSDFLAQRLLIVSEKRQKNILLLHHDRISEIKLFVCFNLTDDKANQGWFN